MQPVALPFQASSVRFMRSLFQRAQSSAAPLGAPPPELPAALVAPALLELPPAALVPPAELPALFDLPPAPELLPPAGSLPPLGAPALLRPPLALPAFALPPLVLPPVEAPPFALAFGAPAFPLLALMPPWLTLPPPLPPCAAWPPAASAPPLALLFPAVFPEPLLPPEASGSFTLPPEQPARRPNTNAVWQCANILNCMGRTELARPLWNCDATSRARIRNSRSSARWAQRLGAARRVLVAQHKLPPRGQYKLPLRGQRRAALCTERYALIEVRPLAKRATYSESGLRRRPARRSNTRKTGVATLPCGSSKR